ncbi:hypothetical protein GCM10010517_61000 [Streptosporangium fragile]|uniref:Uncharacterized protein n=1 Tax=Streptosporangium fragile TaxID=46186 RepID=A0ABP6IPE3_9ACTN
MDRQQAAATITDPRDRLSRALTGPQALDDDTIERLEARTVGFHRLEYVLPARAISQGLTTHINELSTLLQSGPRTGSAAWPPPPAKPPPRPPGSPGTSNNRGSPPRSGAPPIELADQARRRLPSFLPPARAEAERVPGRVGHDPLPVRVRLKVRLPATEFLDNGHSLVEIINVEIQMELLRPPASRPGVRRGAGPGRRWECGPPAVRSTRRTKPRPPTTDAPPHRYSTTITMLWPAITRGWGRSTVRDFVSQPRPTGQSGCCPACR